MKSIIRSYIASHPFGAGVAATIAILLGGTSLAAAAKHIGPLINGTVAYVANTAGPVVYGDNLGSGVGVEGVTDTGAAAGAIALQGFGTSSTHASVGVNGAVQGPGSTALIGNANAASGAASVGLEGFAKNGEGVFAQSTNPAYVSLRSVDANAFYDVRLSDSVTGNGMTSLLTTFGNAAVSGQDTEASSSSNIGVFGSSASGLYGVEGLIGGNGFAGVYGQDNTTSTNQFGVEGFSANGRGVFGNSASGQGVYGSSTNVQGVLGNSTNGNGAWGQSANNDGTDGFTTNPSATQAARSGGYFLDNSSDGGTHNFGLTAQSTNGVGIQGNTTSGIAGGYFTDTNLNGVWGVGGNYASVGQCNGPGANEFGGSPDGVSVNFSVNCSGVPSAIIPGHHHLYANATFAQTTEPVIEDFGSGQLVNGVAAVRLDQSFADAITYRAPYMVFITPDGDSRGLYVTQKTLQGFVVRESGGGTSSIGFDYRIVSRPATSTQSRMYAISARPSLLPRGMVGPNPANAARMMAEHIAAFRAVNAAIRERAARNTKVAAAPRLASRWPIFEPRMLNGKLRSLPFKPTIVHPSTKPQT